MTSAPPRRQPFQGFYIGAILAAILIVSGIQTLIIGLDPPFKWLISSAVNLVLHPFSISPLTTYTGWWPYTAEMVVAGILFMAIGIRLGSWLCCEDKKYIPTPNWPA